MQCFSPKNQLFLLYIILYYTEQCTHNSAVMFKTENTVGFLKPFHEQCNFCFEVFIARWVKVSRLHT